MTPTTRKPTGRIYAVAHAPLRAAAEALAAAFAADAPADKQLERYFRAHPGLGARDRGFVAETVYGCLRRGRFLEHVTGAPIHAPQAAGTWVGAYLLAAQGWSARALAEAGYGGDAPALAARVRTVAPETLPLGVQTDLPDWLLERLLAQLGETETRALAAALNQPAPVDLRVNTLKARREAVQARLAAEGYAAEPTPWSPVGLRRHDRSPLFQTGAFQDGWFEVQDEGSQLVGLLVEPRRQEQVVDFCAGAGGKTLHLGALMANTGTLYAFDVSPARLARFKPRLKRSGMQNVRLQAISHERDPRVRRLAGKIDRVLVDAPCSGTGTLRRNPDLKWRPTDLAALVAVERRILAAAAELVKPGGRLVYATCSLLREENEDVVADFLASRREFEIVPAGEILARREVPLAVAGDALRLYPHRHGTDGFYAIALERRRA